MKTGIGTLTYCTNIHPGETWAEHFAALQEHIPAVRKQLGADGSFGIGLRLSNKASLALDKAEQLSAFKDWLQENDAYVFTLNGFPYGSFHRTRVKDQVHAPDWTTNERLQYTLRLFRILAALLPEGMEGSLSTSPLSYRYWHPEEERRALREKATWNMLQVVEQLARVYRGSGILLHLDVEPEPDGLLDNGSEFIAWYLQELLPAGIPLLSDKLDITAAEAEQVIKTHLQLCYDVCHFAVGYEDADEILRQLKIQGIRIGKIQLSAALKSALPHGDAEREKTAVAFRRFNESTYLHQVVARCGNGRLIRYRDLPEALQEIRDTPAEEWRAHFHVPLFVSDFGLLQSTRNEVAEMLRRAQQDTLTRHFEVETYTWEVLPSDLQLPLPASIARELQWVLDTLNNTTG